jgi:alpha-beta hydrolase superfamily lysophospholipase
MLNKTAGDRDIYRNLAMQLAERGIASLRLDLRDHGSSINQGQFIPGKNPPDPRYGILKKT